MIFILVATALAVYIWNSKQTIETYMSEEDWARGAAMAKQRMEKRNADYLKGQRSNFSQALGTFVGIPHEGYSSREF